MEKLLSANNLPFEIGALYNRRQEIHDPFGGQRQGGISTPASSPYVFLFTGEAGEQHGYHDFWDDENNLHYYGEGQSGHMQDRAGNRAIREHLKSNKRLLLFQMMGRGRPYRFLGEFQFRRAYEEAGVSDTHGNPRTAIVFILEPVQRTFDPFQPSVADKPQTILELSATASTQLTEVRSKQSLFKRRLLTVEKQCRLTGLADLRFLRASHIKPWAKCISGDERIDGNNGLLLSPQADLLFDRGWITFEDKGSLVRSENLPDDVIKRLGLNLRQGRNCGAFFESQRNYLEFHRNQVFEKAYKKAVDPLLDLILPAKY